jgi:hypothetical protein
MAQFTQENIFNIYQECIKWEHASTSNLPSFTMLII